MTDDTAALIEAAGSLAREAERLPRPERAHTVYNPLAYAWQPHAEYLRRYGTGPKRVLFLGMNPGPWGMAQTGVPFGEVAAVTGWLGISAPVDAPEEEHPARPVHGYRCRRSEVSGRRLWGLFSEHYGSPQRFFREHFVANYCPLLFMEESGRNLTPEKLEKEYRRRLFAVCDNHLQRLIETLRPRFLLGVGAFAEKRLRRLTEERFGQWRNELCIGSVLHPSPASPKANRGWAEQAESQLRELGVWEERR